MEVFLMAEQNTKVADDMVVSLDYTLRLDNGDVIDTSAGREPLQFVQGTGGIITGLEDALYGMSVGEEKEVVVQPDAGYGAVDDQAYQRVSRQMFPEDLDLEEGMGLRLRDQDTGQPVNAYVAELKDDNVLLDFNHPLAGETLYFDVKVVDVRQATDEEIDHDHTH
jgi:FKBP-type peptidyl-prolyl cis-trans isomerase SlyD